MSPDYGKIIVTDIKIPFRSMVVLMVKWAVATIPALIILILIGSIMQRILLCGVRNTQTPQYVILVSFYSA
jgi:hypothetical protein